jgi:hypothetical protein
MRQQSTPKVQARYLCYRRTRHQVVKWVTFDAGTAVIIDSVGYVTEPKHTKLTGRNYSPCFVLNLYCEVSKRVWSNSHSMLCICVSLQGLCSYRRGW